MKKLLSFLILFASSAQAQYGYLPAYTTGTLPTCDASHINRVVVNTDTSCVVVCDGASWTCATSGGTPGGANTEVQYNDTGAFGAEPAFAYTAGSDLLTLGNLQLADGSFAAPSSSYSSEATLGTFRAAAGLIGVRSSLGMLVTTAFTDISNYEGLFLNHTNLNYSEVRPASAGTGTDNLGLNLASLGSSNVNITAGTTGAVVVGSARPFRLQDASNYLEFAQGNHTANRSWTLTSTTNVTLDLDSGNPIFADAVSVTAAPLADPATASAASYGGTGIVFEGSGADANETTLSVVNPTADVVYSFPDRTAATYDVMALSADGIAVRTGSGTQAARSVASGAGITVANGDGVSGNPTVSVDSATIPSYAQGTADPPATCTAGAEIYTETDTGEVYYCRATNTWDLIYTSNTVVAVADGGTGLSSGTSGGVLAYTAAGTLASSGALTADLPVIGGGAGVAPTVGTRSGNTTAYVTTTGAQTSGDCVKIDANGNHIANGSACGGGTNFGFAFLGSSSGNTLTAGQTTYFGPNTANPADDITNRSVPIPAACTLRNLRIMTNNSQPATGSLVFTIRNETTAADTAVTITVAANEAGGLKSDLVNSTAISAGDRIALRGVNNASSASQEVKGWSYQCN